MSYLIFFTLSVLLQNILQSAETFHLRLIRNNREVRIAVQHSRKISLALVVENKHWGAVCFGITKFIANTKRWTCTFGYHDVALSKLSRIPLVYMSVDGLRLSFKTHV